jgi:hypothetical protein
MPGLHAGHAAEQQAAPAVGFLKVGGAGLHRHAPSHFAHRRQQGQTAARAGDGLVGDADGTGLDQRFGLLRIGCKVQVGIEDLPGAQHRALHGLRFLDFHDHLGARKDLGGRGHHLGSGGHVLRIGQVDRGTGIGLHQHLMAMGRELAHAGRRQADTVFMVLDFLGYADEHVGLLMVGSTGLCARTTNLRSCFNYSAYS